MGRAKEYRQRLKYQVASAEKKTLENMLAVQFKDELGLSEVEARLLSRRVSNWVIAQPDLRGPNQIYLEASNGRDTFARRLHVAKKVMLTPYATEDLELEFEFGLAVMQLGRILRLIEEAHEQDALLSGKQLTLLCHITPTSLRGRLKEVREEGLWAPLMGLSRADRQRGGQFRSTLILNAYLTQKEPLVEIRRKFAVSRQRFSDLLSRFGKITKAHSEDYFNPAGPEEAQWADSISSMPQEKRALLLDQAAAPQDRDGHDSFWAELKTDFALSPVKLRAIRETVEEILAALSKERSDGDIVYWAVADREPAGKPLEACRLVPLNLTLYDPADMPPNDLNRDLNRVSEIKFEKVLRLSTQAKQGGGYLTYADLSYLLGLHPEAISRLVRANPTVVIPLRGSECDIGRGVTHRQKIIRLYLEMHTETEIAARSGHSYEAIEEYIKEFATIYVLTERGMPAALIRRVTGRSTKLIKTYLELIAEFDQPEYAFRFHHLQKIFSTYEDGFKKNPLEEKR